MVIGLGAALLAAVLFGGGAVMQAVAARRGPLVSRMMGLVVADLRASAGHFTSSRSRWSRCTSHRSASPPRWRSRRSWPPGSWVSRSRSGTGSQSAHSSEASRSCALAQVPSAPTSSMLQDVVALYASLLVHPADRAGDPARPRTGAAVCSWASSAGSRTPVPRSPLALAGRPRVGLADDPPRHSASGSTGSWASGCTPSRCGGAAVIATSGPLVLLQTVVPAIVGVVRFDDSFRPGWWPVAVFGFLVSTARRWRSTTRRLGWSPSSTEIAPLTDHQPAERRWLDGSHDQR